MYWSRNYNQIIILKAYEKISIIVTASLNDYSLC